MSSRVNDRVRTVVAQRVIKIDAQQIDAIESHEVSELQTDVCDHVTAEDIAAGVAGEARKSVQVQKGPGIHDDFVVAAKVRSPIIADKFHEVIQFPYGLVMLPDHVVIFDDIVRGPPLSLIKREIDFVRRERGFRFKFVKIADRQARPVADYETALALMTVFELLQLPVPDEIRAALLEKRQHPLAVAINVKRIETLIQRHSDLQPVIVGSAGDKPGAFVCENSS